MYTAFYGLREKPFALSPDPRFLYLAGSHREALAHLLYGIEQGEGFISITGEVGTGKTTLCRTLLERIDSNLELAFLFNPSRTALELLQSICAEFGLPAEGLNRRTLMTQLNKFLVEQKAAGRRVLLIIDEAQTLSENTLEQVRLLSNLETSREKLIQILLLGQPELDRKLDEQGLRQLRQRISVRWQLDPLGAQETRAYVRHRLAVAAGEPKELFTESALREVYRRTGGIPRLVNQLCDRALLAGYAGRAAQITPRIVRAAAAEIPDAYRRRMPRGEGSTRSFLRRPWLIAGGALALVGLSLWAGLQFGAFQRATAIRDAVVQLGSGSDPARRPRADVFSEEIPAVGANAPVQRQMREDGPDVSELIGDMPVGLRNELRLSPGQIDPSVAGEGAAATPYPVETFPEDSGSTNTPTPYPDPGAYEEEVLSADPELAMAPGLLPDMLEKRDRGQALSASRGAVLERFGRVLESEAMGPRSPKALQRSLLDLGLTATSFDGGSIELLRRLDHPVLIPLATRPTRGELDQAATNQRWLAITGFRNDRARVAGLIPDRIVTIEIKELERHWLETGMIVWEQFEKVPAVMLSEDEGDGVRWLQVVLGELDFLQAVPTGRFDWPTTEAVVRFQRERGLIADGVAGPLTQIALYAELSRYPVPRLSGLGPSTPPSQSSSASPYVEAGLGTGVDDVEVGPPDATSVHRSSGDRG